jgi:hypothetical protein
MAMSPDTTTAPITLEMLGALLRQVQADQRNIRTEQETMRGLLVQMAASQTATLAVFQDAILKRLGESEALMETRFDGIVALLATPKTGG